MAAKGPKITQAQRELEAAQQRALREQERERNIESSRIELFSGRLQHGLIGYKQLLNPGSNVPTAQGAGTTINPSFTDPAIAALEKQAAYTRMAEGFGSQARDNIRALTMPFKTF